MKKRVGVISSIFTCDDCGRVFECYKNAQALAAKHAKHYKHRVDGEVCIGVSYNGNKP